MTAAGKPSPRDRTREEIYRLIRNSPGLSRPALVERTGLSSSTVGHAVGRLLDEGRVRETATTQKGPGSGSGRPATLLTALPTHTLAGALDFGHQHFRVGLGDDLGNVLVEQTVHIDVDRSPRDALEAATTLLSALVAEHADGDLAAVGLGVPGPIERTTGIVRSTTTLSNWDGMNPAAEVTARLGVPAISDNDASLGAFGELRLGAGRGLSNFLYIKASHGVGAGFVIGGEPYRGASGFAGEIAHTVIPGRPELCRCGNHGCLEAVVSVPSVTQQLLHTHPDLNPDAIDLSSMNDLISERILNEVGRTLGRVLADICNLLNPGALIIGGGLGNSGTALIDGVRSSIGRFAQPGAASVARVMPAALGDRAEIIGALLLAGNLAQN
jgi:predicted NBD/HSP70 family sugar kinase